MAQKVPAGLSSGQIYDGEMVFKDEAFNHMKMTKKFIAFLLGILILAPGCFNAENDRDHLIEERNALAEELAKAQKENMILTRSLANIKKEQDALQALLHVGRSLNPSLPSPAGSQTTAPLPPLTIDNSAAPRALVADDELWAEPSQLPAPRTPAQSTTPSGRIYEVQPGDVLSSIAMRNGTNVERLVELNPWLKNRNNYMLRSTDKLQLP